MLLTMSKVKTLDVDANALIRPLRELCGLTQEQFAARLDVTIVTVNRRGNYRLALQQVKSLLMEVNQSKNAD
jgi:putative transcriptional regulator